MAGITCGKSDEYQRSEFGSIASGIQHNRMTIVIYAREHLYINKFLASYVVVQLDLLI